MKAGYTCDVCGHKTTDIEFRERFEGEKLEHYIHSLQRVVTFDHDMSQPGCRAKTMNLLIPMSANGIGVDGPELTDEEKVDLRKQLRGY